MDFFAKLKDNSTQLTKETNPWKILFCTFLLNIVCLGFLLIPVSAASAATLNFSPQAIAVAESIEEAEAQAQETLDDTFGAGTSDQVEGQIEQATGAVQQKAGELTGQVQGAVKQVQGKAKEDIGQVKEATEEASSEVKETSEGIVDKVKGFFKQ